MPKSRNGKKDTAVLGVRQPDGTFAPVVIKVDKRKAPASDEEKGKAYVAFALVCLGVARPSSL